MFVFLDYDVTLIPMYDTEHAGRYTEELRALGAYCPVSPALSSAAEFVEKEGASFDAIMLFRVIVAHSVLELCRIHAPRAKIIFNTVDLHFLREAREGEILQSEALRSQSEATRKEELRCVASADATIVVSLYERELLQELVPGAVPYLVSAMRPAPGRLAPREGRTGVIFVGGFGHSPNVDAVRFLCKDIWPIVREHLPAERLTIIGADPPREIVTLTDWALGIDVLGFVPDVAPYYCAARVNVASLRFGAGIKGKVLSAMIVGLPTVATSVGVEGMGLSHGQDIWIADNAVEIAKGIIALCTNDELWESMSEKGLCVANANFSVEAQVPRIRKLLRDVSLPVG
jgi:glycosyltransferase involved in cell wall biosynthesis